MLGTVPPNSKVPFCLVGSSVSGYVLSFLGALRNGLWGGINPVRMTHLEVSAFVFANPEIETAALRLSAG